MAFVINILHSETRDRQSVYSIQVQHRGHTWCLWRRYNEFEYLFQALRKKHGIIVPALPKQITFLGKMINQKRDEIEKFLQKLALSEILIEDPETQYFLNVANNLSGKEDDAAAEHDLKSAIDDSQRPVSSLVPNSAFPGGAQAMNPEAVPRDTATSNGVEMNPENNATTAIVTDANNPLYHLGLTERRGASAQDFDFLRIIGKGSFGTVLMARHKQEDKIYAVKVLKKELIIKKNEQKHIMAERNVLLKTLSHPFLAKLHYSFQSSKKLFFVLDLVNGGEMFFHLQRERIFAESRARFYAAEMASALGYLHKQKIIYRDLKPENILLDNEGHITLTDFGLCKEHMDYNDTTSTFCGTPEYLAPEILQKKPYKMIVDWWCLGAVLYEMLYGLPPFYARDQKEMYHRILTQQLHLKPSSSDATRHILASLLNKNPDERLGARFDFQEIAHHPFFNPINWADLESKKIRPPYKPNLNGVTDLSNIDKAFFDMPVPDSIKHTPYARGVYPFDKFSFEGITMSKIVEEAMDQA